MPLVASPCSGGVPQACPSEEAQGWVTWIPGVAGLVGSIHNAQSICQLVSLRLSLAVLYQGKAACVSLGNNHVLVFSY